MKKEETIHIASSSRYQYYFIKNFLCVRSIL